MFGFNGLGMDGTWEEMFDIPFLSFGSVEDRWMDGSEWPNVAKKWERGGGRGCWVLVWGFGGEGEGSGEAAQLWSR